MRKATSLFFVLIALAAMALAPARADALVFTISIQGPDTFYPGQAIGTPFSGTLTALGSASVPAQNVELRLDGVTVGSAATDTSGAYSIPLPPINDTVDHVVSAVAFAGTPLETTASTVIEIKRFMLTVSLTGTHSGQVTSTPAGISCPSMCTTLVPATTSVQLSAVAAPGAIFTGWTGDCAGPGNCTVSMTQSRTVGARFDTPAQLIVTPGSWSGSVPANQTVYQTFTVKNVGGATAGPIFWTVNGSDASYYFPASQSCSGVSLAGGQSCSIVLRFTQGGLFFTGPKYASMYISATPGGSLFVPLSVG